MWFYVQMWLPIVTVALTAAICFSVASFIMGRSVKPHQLYLYTHSGRNNRNCCEYISRPFRR
jgi:hypothetical protein